MKTRLALSLLAGIVLAGAGLVSLIYIITMWQLPGDIRAQALPDLQVTRLDGTATYLRDLGGQPMVVNFWATWCPPCIEEMPALEELHRALAGEISVVAVNLGEDPGVVQAYLDEHNSTLPVLLDQTEQVAHVLSIGYLPATLFVDAKGVIRSSYKGALSPEQMEQGASTLQRRFNTAATLQPSIVHPARQTKEDNPDWCLRIVIVAGRERREEEIFLERLVDYAKLPLRPIWCNAYGEPRWCRFWWQTPGVPESRGEGLLSRSAGYSQAGC